MLLFYSFDCSEFLYSNASISITLKRYSPLLSLKCSGNIVTSLFTTPPIRTVYLNVKSD